MITDQITDQDTPYCDELSYAVCNKIRVLAQIRCTCTEHNPVLGHHLVNLNVLKFLRVYLSTETVVSHIPHTICRSSTYYYNRRVPKHSVKAYGLFIRQALSKYPEEAAAYAKRLGDVLEGS